MKKIITQILLLIIISIGNQILFAQTSPIVKANLDKDTILIGDQVHLTLLVSGIDKNTQVTWPALPDSIKGWEIVDTGKIDTLRNQNAISLQQQFTITSFDSGAYSIPAFSFSIAQKGNTTAYTTPPLTLHVNTIAVDTNKAFMPINDIVQVEQPGFLTRSVQYIKNHTWLVIGIIVTLGLITFLLFYLLKKKKEAIDPYINETPYERSYRLLKELEAEHYIDQGRTKEHYSQLSDIIREYLERQFGVNAMEQTTNEVLANAKKKPELRKVRTELKSLLNTADLVKFAKANPLHEEHFSCIDAAYFILNKTKPEEKKPESAQ